MFERYTDKARRVMFFARYEASQFGSPYIETEHLLLGLLREDKALANRLLPYSYATAEAMRKQIEGHTGPREKVSTSVDLPLSHQCRRVLAYGAEESDRLNHKHVGTEHLLLGLLREPECFAAQLLREHGIILDSVREQMKQWQAPVAPAHAASAAKVDQWLDDLEARGGIRTVRQKGEVAIYPDDLPRQNQKEQEIPPADKAAEIRNRVDSILERMERAIANHEFETARLLSEEEEKERGKLRALREEFHLQEPPPPVPLLRIGIILNQRFSEVLRRCDDYLAQGVPQVWLLDPDRKRAYTATQTEGLREFKGGILRIANPAVEMDLSTIFEV